MAHSANRSYAQKDPTNSGRIAHHKELCKEQSHQPRAFEAFTTEIARWWQPDGLFRFTDRRDGTLHFEPGVDGRLVEAYPDGSTFTVGEVLAWEPPDRLAITWRQASFGPEIRIGAPPEDIRGTSRIRRNGEAIFEKPFLSGEANMSHSFANLEHHHFKYDLFRQPGDVHVHMFGTATLSFADGIKPEEGDVFEIECADFGLPLRNPLKIAEKGTVDVHIL